MATVTARNVDDRDYASLNALAQSNQRSISAELRAIIAEAARKQRNEDILAEMRAIRAQTKGRLGGYPDSVALIRAVRDEG